MIDNSPVAPTDIHGLLAGEQPSNPNAIDKNRRATLKKQRHAMLDEAGISGIETAAVLEAIEGPDKAAESDSVAATFALNAVNFADELQDEIGQRLQSAQHALAFQKAISAKREARVIDYERLMLDILPELKSWLELLEGEYVNVGDPDPSRLAGLRMLIGRAKALAISPEARLK